MGGLVGLGLGVVGLGLGVLLIVVWTVGLGLGLGVLGLGVLGIGLVGLGVLYSFEGPYSSDTSNELSSMEEEDPYSYDEPESSDIDSYEIVPNDVESDEGSSLD